MYQLLRCFGNWVTNKERAFLGPEFATSVARLKTGGKGGGFVDGGVACLGRKGDLLHGSMPGLIGIAVTPILLARDLGARGGITPLIKNCGGGCFSLRC